MKPPMKKWTVTTTANAATEKIIVLSRTKEKAERVAALLTADYHEVKSRDVDAKAIPYKSEDHPTPEPSHRTLKAMTTQPITTIINDYIDSGSMFTAYDVTRKAYGQSADALHPQRKHLVHDMLSEMQRRGYTRTLIQMPNGRAAWVYHPIASDPTDYKP